MNGVIVPINLEGGDIISVSMGNGEEIITRVEREGVVIWTRPGHYETVLAINDGEVRVKGFTRIQTGLTQ